MFRRQCKAGAWLREQRFEAGQDRQKDSVKLANYGLDRWLALTRYVPEEDTRLLLKNCYRQYRQYSKVQTVLKNNLISLLDTVFPNVNRLFSSPAREDGSEKWVDFVAEFWHCRCVSEKSEKAFANKYQRWCRKYGYNSMKQRRTRFTPKPADTLVSCQCPKRPSQLWNRRLRLRATSTALAAQTRNASIDFHASGISRCHGYVRRRPDSGAATHSRNRGCAPLYSKKALVAYAGLMLRQMIPVM